MTSKGTDDLVALKKAAAEGEGEAQKRLGEAYFLQRDYGQAEAWLSKAASRNVPGAEDMWKLVDAFRFKRKKLIRRHLDLAAELGSPGDLGFLHLAAEEGIGEAQQLLGELYLSGKEVPRDCRQAAKWLSRAAKHKGSRAEGLLRQHLLRAARCNDPDALDFLQGAAAEGVDEARYVLEFLKCKNGPQRNYRQAARWLSSAARRNRFGTGELLREELRHAAEDRDPHGLEFLRGAAEEGVGEAQKLLGEMYLSGSGVPRDSRQAGKWLGRAVKRKGSGAEGLLRQLLRRTKQRKSSDALDFLQGAASEGVAEAQKLLGEKHRFGKGVPRDRRKAVRIDPPIGPRPRPRPGANAQGYRNDWTGR